MPDEISGLERAKSHFVLFEPAPASEKLWDAYTAERRAVQEKSGTVLGNDSDSESDEYGYDEGDGALALAITNAVRLVEEEMGLPKDSLVSGISIVEEDALFEEENQPRTVQLLTRIYSVASPTSVDLHFAYHSRSRYDSIEWYSAIGYKINTRPSPNKLPDASRIFRQIGIPKGSNFSFTMYTGNGWNNFYKAFYDDERGFSGRHWKRYEVKDMGLYEDGLKDVHDALLGPHPCMDDETPQNPDTITLKRQRLVQTARLLLACVGVNCSIAVTDSEVDSLPAGWRSSGLEWNLEGIPSWFAREIRKAAGFQLERDAEEAKRYSEAVQDEIKGFYDDDEDGSSDDGFNFDDEDSDRSGDDGF